MADKKYVLLSLLAIMAIAVFFRLWDIKSIPPGFYPDEAMYANNALEAWETKNFKIFYPENNGREGLWINIISLPLAILGNEPWVPRGVAAFFGILTVLGLYFLAKELFSSDRVALLASFFMATSFWHINFSRIGFRAILAPFFLVWSFYFLWRAFKKAEFFNSLSLPRRRRDVRPRLELKNLLFSPSIIIAASGLLFGLGFHTYIAYRVAPLLLIIPFMLLWKARRKKLILIFLIFAFLAALPLGIYFLKNPQDFFGRASQLSIFAGQSPVGDFGLNILKTIGMFFFRGDYNWRHNLAGAPQLWWPVAILFLFGSIMYCKNCFRGLAKIWRKLRSRVEKSNCLSKASFGFFVKRGDYNLPKSERLSENNFYNEKTFLLAWLIILLIPTIISNEGLPHALRGIVVIPAIMIFSALGLEEIIVKASLWLTKKMEQYPQYSAQLKRIRKEFVALLFFFAVAAVGQTFNQYFLRWAPNPNVADAFIANYVKIGRYLNTLPEDIPKYVIINADGVDVYGIPMPSQTVMFITKTYLPKWQSEKNIFYIPMKNLDSFIGEAKQKENLYIAMLENDAILRAALKEKINGLKIDASSGIITLHK